MVGLSLGLAACGNKKADKPKVKMPSAPAVDCAHFQKRADECADDFLKSYAATKFGARTRGANADEKAGNLKKALGFLKTSGKQNSCEHMPAWGNLKQKDPRWRVRYHKCAKDAACGVWGKCVGNALGQPLK